MNKFVFVLVLLAGVVIVGGLAIVPLSAAKARNMDARNAGLSRIAAAAALEAEQSAAVRIQERRSMSRWYTGGGIAVVVVGVTVTAFLGLAVATRAGADISRSYRTARMPVAQQIAPGAYIYQLDGVYWILDSYTGSRALLSDRAGRDAVHALITDRLLTIDRLAASAERIANSTHNAQPADWLPQIGSYQSQIEVENQ